MFIEISIPKWLVKESYDCLVSPKQKQLKAVQAHNAFVCLAIIMLTDVFLVLTMCWHYLSYHLISFQHGQYEIGAISCSILQKGKRSQGRVPPPQQVWFDFEVHILNPKLYCFPQVPLFCTYDIPARAYAFLRHERDELGSLKCSLVNWRSFAEHAANGPPLGGSFFFWVPNARTAGEISLRPSTWSGNKPV